jgi:hypothetical protein
LDRGETWGLSRRHRLPILSGLALVWRRAGEVSEEPKIQELPEKVAAIKVRGFAVWATAGLSPEFTARFDRERIPVVGIRHVRQWGIQVDDERTLPGRERTSIPDEDLWEVQLVAKDGSTYEVNVSLVMPAPQ